MNNTGLIDTHVHLQHPAFAEEREAILSQAAASGVVGILDVSDNLPTALAAVDFAARMDSASLSVRVAVGVHPHHAAEWNAQAEESLCALLTAANVVALGEIGLDYHYDFALPECQLLAFSQQLQVAQQYKLPVIVHAREADTDILRCLREVSPLTGVVHCFWSDIETARAILDMGMYIGVGGAITFKNATALRQVITQVPLERVLLETDAPYLAPVPKRGRRNEPSYVLHVAQALAQIYGCTLEEVARVTSYSARHLFDFPGASAQVAKVVQ